MIPAGLHLDRGNCPAFSIPVNLSPFHVVDHAGAGNGQGIKPKCVADNVTEQDTVSLLMNQPEQADHVFSFGEARPWCRNIDGELFRDGTEWIVTVALDVGPVADLLTDVANPVAGFQSAFGLHRTEKC